MQSPPRPTDETTRLEVLRRYHLLDTLPEQALDDLAALAAAVCEAPICLVSLVDEHRQWFKSRIGFPLRETAREVSFCGHAILAPGLFIVEDASQDERFADNPLVTRDPRIRFYAGAPLVAADGQTLGTLCVMDHVPRHLSAAQQHALGVLSRQVIAQFDLRRQTHELAVSEAHLRLVTENARIGLVIVDADGRYVYANSAHAGLYGKSPSAIVGRPVDEVLPEHCAEQMRPLLERAFRGEHVAQELDGAGADGERVHAVYCEPTAPPDSSGCVVVVVTDITDRKRAEEQLRASGRFAQSTIDALSAHICVLDEAGAIIATNEAWRRFAAANTPNEWHAATDDNYLDVCDRASGAGADFATAFAAGIRRVIRGEAREQFSMEYPCHTPTEQRWFIGHVTRFPGEGPLRVVVAHEDVTARKRAEEARIASEGRYHTLFEYAPDGILIADRESNYIEANPSICRMLGYTREELVGRHASLIVAPSEVRHIAPALEIIKSHSDYHREWQFRRKDGSLFPAEVIATEMPDGKLVGMVRDVTERRNLEAQYQQAQKMEAIGRLAGGVAHDFNNLLTAILGYCELLLIGLAPDDERCRDIGNIQQAGLHAASLTRQLLAFSRNEIIEPARLDLNAIVTAMGPMLERLIGEDVGVSLRLSPTLGKVMADGGQIEQVVMNLAVNARDAMPMGGRLTIETANVDLDEHYVMRHFAVTPGPYVMLALTDTGCGITPDVQARMFEPFFTTKEVGKGTGLGLATIHGIVTRSGGTIGVYSEVGKGTSFKVYLPRIDGGAPTAPVQSTRPPRTTPKTILVVEDADQLRDLTQRLLERMGHTVVTAATAQQARLAFAREAAIDLVLTDVIMPGVNGPELVRELQAERPSLDVIYMSGYTDDAIVHHGVLDAGIVFLQKPFTSDALAQKLREVSAGQE